MSLLSVTSIPGNSGAYQVSFENAQQQRASSFQALGQSLLAGNLAGAQQAYSTLQQLMPGSPPTTAATPSQTNPLANDMRALGQALQSGDLVSAQKDYAQLQQDINTAQQTHMGHHHHHGYGLPWLTAASSTSPTLGVSLNLTA